MKLNRFLSVFLVFLFLVSPVFSQEKLGLQDLVMKALSQNYGIQSAKISSQILEKETGLARAGLLPTLSIIGSGTSSVKDTETELSTGSSISGTAANSSSSSLAFQVSYTLFDGFAGFNKLNRSQKLLDSSEIQAKQVVENTIYNVAELYYSILKQTQLVDIQTESVSLSKTRYELAEKQNALGGASSLQALNAKVDWESDQGVLLQDQLQLRQLYRQLNAVLGEGPDSPLSLRDDSIFDSGVNFEQYRNLALSENTSIRLLETQTQVSLLDVKLAQASLYPKLTFTGQYGTSRSDSDTSTVKSSDSTGVDLTLGLTFNFLNTKYTVKKAKLAAQDVVLLLENVKRDVQSQMSASLDAVMQFRELIALTQDKVKTTQLTFERAQSLYNRGQLTPIELRDTQLKLIQAEKQLNDLKFQLRMAQIRVYQLSGSLLTEVKK